MEYQLRRTFKDFERVYLQFQGRFGTTLALGTKSCLSPASVLLSWSSLP